MGPEARARQASRGTRPTFRGRQMYGRGRLRRVKPVCRAHDDERRDLRVANAPQGVSFRETLARLSGAQKGAARSAPAYSRFINRRLGRVFAAGAYRLGMTPNQVTTVSAFFTFTGTVLLGVLRPSWTMGAVVTLLLVIGYALDSADGQVARLTGTGSAAGEWLDHVVDSGKIVAQPLAVTVGLARSDAVDERLLLVPIANCVIGVVLFFAMILTEQLRRAQGVVSAAPTGGRMSWLRPLLVLPTDYGVLCFSYLLLGSIPAFMSFYAFLTAATGAFLVLALRKWFVEVRSFGRRGTSPAS